MKEKAEALEVSLKEAKTKLQEARTKLQEETVKGRCDDSLRQDRRCMRGPGGSLG